VIGLFFETQTRRKKKAGRRKEKKWIPESG
jgi:hypothetical protein